MLCTNLSTRPFYNVRAVQAVLGTAAVLVLGLTLYNSVRIVQLGMRYYRLGARAAASENEAARLQAEAARIRAQIDPQEVQVVADAAREANAIIDQRVFSWTDLLAHFETTLPPDVRITAVQPRLQRGGDFVVAVGVEARRAEDLDAFIEALETSGGFRNVLAIQQQTSAAGLLQAVVEGSYVPPARAGAAPGRNGASR